MKKWMLGLLLVLIFAVISGCGKRTTVDLWELETAAEMTAGESASETTAMPTAVETEALPETEPEKAEPQAVPEPREPEPQAGEYVLNINSKKIHVPTCEAVQKMKESNKKQYTGAVSDLEAQGYVPCKLCKPQ